MEDDRDNFSLIKMGKLSKRGQVNSIAPAIIALVVASAFLVFGLIMIQETRDTDIVTTSQAGTITNESSTMVVNDNQSYYVQKAGDRGANSFKALAIHPTNDTDVDLTSTNYTLTSTGILYYSATSEGIWNDTLINVTYTYNHGGEAYENANETLVGLGTMADFWEIIVLAIVISVVIGLLIVVFGGRRQR